MNWLESEDKTWVLHNAKAVQVIAEIRKNETGEVREYFTDEILSDMDIDDYTTAKYHSFED